MLFLQSEVEPILIKAQRLQQIIELFLCQDSGRLIRNLREKGHQFSFRNSELVNIHFLSHI